MLWLCHRFFIVQIKVRPKMASTSYAIEEQDDDTIDQQNRFMAENLSGKVSRLKSVRVTQFYLWWFHTSSDVYGSRTTMILSNHPLGFQSDSE